MGYSQYDPAIQGRAAWNAGKTVGIKRPFTQKQIWAIRFFLDREGRLRADDWRAGRECLLAGARTEAFRLKKLLHPGQRWLASRANSANRPNLVSVALAEADFAVYKFRISRLRRERTNRARRGCLSRWSRSRRTRGRRKTPLDVLDWLQRAPARRCDLSCVSLPLGGSKLGRF